MTHAARPARAGSGRRRRVGRVGAGIADQLLYSASNFALTIFAARSTSVDAFGVFALLSTTYIVIAAGTRGLTAETLVVRFSAADRASWRRAALASGGLAQVVGLVAGLVFAVVGLVAGTGSSHGLGRSALVFGLVLPGLATQDFLRFAAICAKRPGVALANDIAQAVVQYGAIAVLIAADAASTPLLIAAWGGGAYVGAAVGCVGLRLFPRGAGWWRWLTEERGHAVRYALDDVGSALSGNVSTFAVTGVSGLSGTAALRGVQSVFGPPSILNLSLQVAVIPELVRLLQRSVRAMNRLAIAVGLAMALFAAMWGVGAMFVPDRVGRFFFGDTWQVAGALVVYFAVNQVAAGLRQAPVVGLRALGAARRSLNARIVTLTVSAGGAVLGALLGGAHGVGVSVAVTGPLIAAAVWWQYRLALGEYRRGAVAQHTEVPVVSEGSPIA